MYLDGAVTPASRSSGSQSGATVSQPPGRTGLCGGIWRMSASRMYRPWSKHDPPPWTGRQVCCGVVSLAGWSSNSEPSSLRVIVNAATSRNPTQNPRLAATTNHQAETMVLLPTQRYIWTVNPPW